MESDTTEFLCPICGRYIPISHDTLNNQNYIQCPFCTFIVKNDMKWKIPQWDYTKKD